jgi:acyl-CoA hydrolase
MAVRETQHGLNLATEASWIKVAAHTAGVCLAELNNALPAAARSAMLEDVDVSVIAESNHPPFEVPTKAPDDAITQIGVELASLVSPGSTVQFGPGPIANALVAALQSPVSVDSGIITDAVVDLDARGLLADDPRATYLAGTETLYKWADGRTILDGVEITHDPARLSSLDLVAVNTALQIDLIGQVALEGTPRLPATGIGGHTDYAYAASRSTNGLSIIALPSRRGGQSTLVERLSVPVATPRSVIDVVVTEHGHADLRGLTDVERANAISRLFP